jgi:hypothetical protein
LSFIVAPLAQYDEDRVLDIDIYFIRLVGASSAATPMSTPAFRARTQSSTRRNAFLPRINPWASGAEIHVMRRVCDDNYLYISRPTHRIIGNDPCVFPQNC